MNLHMKFLNARYHLTPSHTLKKQFTACKYLLQALKFSHMKFMQVLYPSEFQ